jgi:hypothetical protein
VYVGKVVNDEETRGTPIPGEENISVRERDRVGDLGNLENEPGRVIMNKLCSPI